MLITLFRAQLGQTRHVMNADRKPKPMNDRKLMLGASATAAALALAMPAIAGAQTMDSNSAPPTVDRPTATTVANPDAFALQSTQVQKLMNLGLMTNDQVQIAAMDPSLTPEWNSSDQDFQAALDSVKVMKDAGAQDAAPMTLREYLIQAGVDPSSVTGMQVYGTSVLILHS